ncbi:phage tail assembly chaperone GT [Rossellomorea marisflavi]
MDTIIKDYIKNGRDVNEILKMPYHFVLEILTETVKPKKTKSLIAAFGG